MITTKPMSRKLTIIGLSLLGIATFVERANSACDYGTALVPCHDATSESTPGCCPGAGTCAGLSFNVAFTYVTTSNQSWITTCAVTGAPKYLRISAGFPGQCGWVVIHNDCTGTWSETVTAPFTIYNCEGFCG